MNLGGPDLIVILLIVLVLFGAKKLPDLAKGMGQAMKEFQKAKDEFAHELHPTRVADSKNDKGTGGLLGPDVSQLGTKPTTETPAA